MAVPGTDVLGGLADVNYGVSLEPLPTTEIGWNIPTLNAAFQGMNVLTGLANAYMGYKNYKLAKDQFGFAKAVTNRTIANQAKQINNQYDTAAQVAAGMIGSKDAQGNYGMTDQAIIDQYAARAKERYVDGSPIR